MPSSKIYISISILILIILVLITPMKVRAEVGAEVILNNEIETLALKVMTLNIHSAINWYGIYDLDGLVNFIQENNPDIIGLQEVARFWSSMSAFQDIPGELGLRLNMYSAYSASRERNNGNFGNLILSKYPIIQIWAEPLPGILEPRSFAFVQLLIKGARVNFLTTHLGLSVSDRLQQAAKILEFTNQVTGPVILTGDFNGGNDDPAVTNLKQNFHDLQDLGEAIELGTFRSKDGKIGSKMDYILVTPEFGFAKVQVVENFVSDHLPVIAEVILQVEKQNLVGTPVVYQQGIL